MEKVLLTVMDAHDRVALKNGTTLEAKPYQRNKMRVALVDMSYETAKLFHRRKGRIGKKRA